MSDVLSFSEVEGQQVELLPARTVLSVFSAGGPRGGDAGTGAGTGAGAAGGPGGAGSGHAAIYDNWIYVEGDMYNTLTGGLGGAGGDVGGAPDGGAAMGGGGTGGA